MSGRNQSTFIGSMPSSGSSSRRAAAVSPRRGKRVFAVPGANPCRIMMRTRGSSQGGRFSRSEDYVAAFKKSLEHINKHSDTAILSAFDIDETLAESSGTGDRSPLPQEVQKALKTIHGANSRMFTMAATGRTPEDAQIAFGSFQIPLIAKDGSWIRFPDGDVKEYEFPRAEEFKALAKKILGQREESGLDVFQLKELKPAIGLSFSRGEKEVAAFNQYREQFEDMADKRGGELVVYTHFYEYRMEIIIQNGVHTKATGIEKMIAWLKKNYHFHHVLLFAHGNSSNDVPMIKLANKLKDRQDQRLGGSFWVGEYNQVAKYSLERVSVLQQGIIELAQWLDSMGWRAPRSGGSSRK